MKKYLRIVSVVAMFSMALNLFSGCATKEATVFDAILKTADVNSMESKISLGVNFDIQKKGTNEESAKYMSSSMYPEISILNSIKRFELTANNKMVKSGENAIKQQSDFEIGLGGIYTKFSTWFDISGEENGVNKFLVKLPPIATSFYPDAFKGREYLSFDQKDLSNINEDVPFSNKLYYGNNFNKEIIKFFSDYAKQFNPDFAYVEQKEDVKVGSETYKAYQLKLTDKTAKALTKYFFTNLINNKEQWDFVKGKIKNLLEDKYKEKFEVGIAEFEKQIPEINKNVDELFKTIEDINIIGEKGIVINYLINDKGYVVKESGVISFKIDDDEFAKLNNLVSSTPKDSKYVVNIDIDFNVENSKINEALSVDFPNPEANNLCSLSKMIEYSNEESKQKQAAFEKQNDMYYLEQGDIGIKVDGFRIYFDYNSEPINLDGRIYAPIRPILDKMEATLAWDEEQNIISIYKDGKKIDLKSGSKIATIDGKSVTMNDAPKVINGRTYLPIRDICELLSCKLEWNDELRFTNIITK